MRNLLQLELFVGNWGSGPSNLAVGAWAGVSSAGLHSHLQQEYLLSHLFQVKKSLVTFKVVVAYTLEQRFGPHLDQS